MTLGLWALALLTGVQAAEIGRQKRVGLGAEQPNRIQAEMLAHVQLSIREISRFLWRLVGAVGPTLAAGWAWLPWRRQHQAEAMTAHYKRRGSAPPKLQL